MPGPLRDFAITLSDGRRVVGHDHDGEWSIYVYAGDQEARLIGYGSARTRPHALEAQGSAPRLVDPSEGELAGALAAPVWGRYVSFRGQPPIAATLRWSVAERSLMLAGTRGTERFEEIPLPATATAAQTMRDASRDVVGCPRQARALASADLSEPLGVGRKCSRCGQPIPASARREARYCSNRCRQADSRARLRERSGRSEGPMPTGLRPEARYCSKRCRQADSRARLRRAPPTRPCDRAARCAVSLARKRHVARRVCAAGWSAQRHQLAQARQSARLKSPRSPPVATVPGHDRGAAHRQRLSTRALRRRL
jgi:endogenous inhibitor of DNA gyrase (YacG/DUF329 family)